MRTQDHRPTRGPDRPTTRRRFAVAVGVAAITALGAAPAAAASSDLPAIPNAHCGSSSFTIANDAGYVFIYERWNSEPETRTLVTHTYIASAPAPPTGTVAVGSVTCTERIG